MRGAPALTSSGAARSGEAESGEVRDQQQLEENTVGSSQNIARALLIMTSQDMLSDSEDVSTEDVTTV